MKDEMRKALDRFNPPAHKSNRGYLLVEHMWNEACKWQQEKDAKICNLLSDDDISDDYESDQEACARLIRNQYKEE